MRYRLPLLLLLWPALASAQIAPGAFSTVRTTDVTGASMCVGCPVGSTTPADNSGVTATTVVLKSNVGSPSVTTNKLYNVSGALYFNGLSLATGSSISGTAGTVPVFTGGSTLANSTMLISGANFTIGSGSFTAGSFIGSGASLTSVPAAQLTGSHSLPDSTLSTNVPLFNAVVAFTGPGTNSFNAAPTGNQVLQVRNTAAGTGNAAYLSVGNDADANGSFLATLSSTFTTSGLMVQDSTQVGGERPGGVSLVASHASGAIRFGTAGAERGRIFSTGGFSWGDTMDPGATNLRVAGTLAVVGAETVAGASTHSSTTQMTGNVSMGSANVTDSVAVPTLLGTGFGTGATITGRDFAFRVTLGTSPSAVGQVTLNQTYATAPVCIASSEGFTSLLASASTSTTIVNVSLSGSWSSGFTVVVICRGF